MHPSHLWRPGRPAPILRSHSLAKHRALDGYLRRYVAAYTQNLRVRHLSLTVVEGFAGGNFYRDENTGEHRHGSPGVILDALAEAAAFVQARRTERFHFADRYFFVEKDEGAFLSLKKSIADSIHASRVGQEIELIHGEFARRLPHIFCEIKKRPGKERSLFILDQCGYKDVPFNMIHLILNTLKNAEVLLTFAVDFLANYLSPAADTTGLQAATGIDFDSLKTEDKLDPNWRRNVQRRLTADIISKTGARYFTPFFIRSEDSNRDLWLVHLSKHVKAKDEMGEMHWDLQTAAAHYGRPGLNMLGFDPGKSGADKEARLPGFQFDELAYRNTVDSLRDELPRKLRDEYGNIAFENLYALIANDTPATRRILKDAIQRMHADGEVVIRTVSGSTYRRSKVQRDDDIIIVPSHKTVLFRFGDEL
jgi:three-Cys-motif partner protein